MVVQTQLYVSFCIWPGDTGRILILTNPTYLISNLIPTDHYNVCVSLSMPEYQTWWELVIVLLLITFITIFFLSHSILIHLHHFHYHPLYLNFPRLFFCPCAITSSLDFHLMDINCLCSLESTGTKLMLNAGTHTIMQRQLLSQGWICTYSM